jgi:hypothetical protein
MIKSVMCALFVSMPLTSFGLDSDGAANARAALAGVMLADDNSLGRAQGDGYAFFHQDRPLVSPAPSAGVQGREKRLSIGELQALSSDGPVWHPPAMADPERAEFRQRSPNILTFEEYQARSSNSSMWMSDNRPSTTAGPPVGLQSISSASR